MADVTTLRFTVPGNPIPWQRAQARNNGGRYTAERTSDYQDLVRKYARRAGARPLACPVRLSCEFFRASAHACDLDNLVKTISDALNELAFEDDRQVVELVAWKRVDRDAPRAVITVEVAA